LREIRRRLPVARVDQSGLLLADNGEAARRERIYTLNQYFAMIRKASDLLPTLLVPADEVIGLLGCLPRCMSPVL
jgi:hypothetical protein